MSKIEEKMNLYARVIGAIASGIGIVFVMIMLIINYTIASFFLFLIGIILILSLVIPGLNNKGDKNE